MILIAGPSTEEHFDNIKKVLRRLSEAGLRLNAVNWQFLKPVLECLGHRVDTEGFHPVEAKVKAIQEAPVPKNPTELKSFLGMLNFYGKFIPNLSSILKPLHSLLRKDVVWKWKVEQQEAFDKVKNQLQSSDILVHFDPKKELVVSCDIPVVLAQFYPMLWKMDQRDLWHTCTPCIHFLWQKETTVT